MLAQATRVSSPSVPTSAELPPHLQINPIRTEAWVPRARYVMPCTMPVLALAGWAFMAPMWREKPRRPAPTGIQFILSQGPSEMPTGPSANPAGGGPRKDEEPRTQLTQFSHVPVPLALPDPARQDPLVDVEPTALLPDVLPPLPTQVIPVPRAGTGHGGGAGSGSGRGVGSGTDVGLSGGWRLHTELPPGVVEVLLEDLTVLNQEVPYYPKAAIADRTQGDVLVTFIVDEKGIPVSWSIDQSDNPVFNEAVIDACPRWRFAPLMLGGKRVKASFVVLFQFHIR